MHFSTSLPSLAGHAKKCFFCFERSERTHWQRHRETRWLCSPRAACLCVFSRIFALTPPCLPPHIASQWYAVTRWRAGSILGALSQREPGRWCSLSLSLSLSLCVCVYLFLCFLWLLAPRRILLACFCSCCTHLYGFFTFLHCCTTHLYLFIFLDDLTFDLNIYLSASCLIFSTLSCLSSFSSPFFSSPSFCLSPSSSKYWTLLSLETLFTGGKNQCPWLDCLWAAYFAPGVNWLSNNDPEEVLIIKPARFCLRVAAGRHWTWKSGRDCTLVSHFVCSNFNIS